MITMWWFDINWIKFRMNSSILFWHRTVCRSNLPLLCVVRSAHNVPYHLSISIDCRRWRWRRRRHQTTIAICWISKEEDTQDFPTKGRLAPYVQQKRHRMQQSHTWTQFGTYWNSWNWFYWIVPLNRLNGEDEYTSSHAIFTLNPRPRCTHWWWLFKLPLPWTRKRI